MWLCRDVQPTYKLLVYCSLSAHLGEQIDAEICKQIKHQQLAWLPTLKVMGYR